MRIGIDVRPLQSTSRERGIGYYLRGLLAGLAQEGMGHRYLLLTIAGRELPQGIGEGLDAETVPLRLEPPGWRCIRPIRYARWLNPVHARRRGMQYDLMLRRRLDMARLAQAVRQARMDVLHLPSVFEPEYFANVGRDFPCPAVQTVHDLIPEVFPELNRNAGWPYWYIRQAGYRSLEQGRGRVAAISESARQDTQRLLPQVTKPIDRIYNGVGDYFQPQTEEQIRKTLAPYHLTNECYFLTNGGLEWRKNLETVLRAFGHYYLSNPGGYVVIPGRLNDEEKTQVQRWAAEAGVPKHAVKMTGFVPDADLPALYSGAAALVFPSRYEGFGLPVVEAMACGTPVITARNSSLPEAGGQAALYVEQAEDVEGLAGAMHKVRQERALAGEMRAKGFAWARQFSWRESARHYLACYEAAAG